MTRFQASGPRVGYKAKEPLKPFKQIVGLYDMWQSLSPDTRNWIASLFGGGKDEVLDTQVTTERDPILDYEVTTGPSTYGRDYENAMESWEGLTPVSVEVGAQNPYNIDWDKVLQ